MRCTNKNAYLDAKTQKTGFQDEFSVIKGRDLGIRAQVSANLNSIRIDLAIPNTLT